eukprot:CAMPEP_0202699384 /NCGR_PEP_ID=MMETSP1385-20130828/12606_1 /ASSEMBLY_ACC=CAM_ASM_000861 /TAXON_ID=933848 /ORGANISM="Elphidium margaritaceum" /LENGTH=969 /DNA_ID=CAMNT_0049356317 /DNA_START=42 /DNA_END=2951 /DNA_ORIENTATION=+
MAKRSHSELEQASEEEHRRLTALKKQKTATDDNIVHQFNPSLLSEKDLQYEEDVKLHPYYLKHWLFYIQTKQDEIDDIDDILQRKHRPDNDDDDDDSNMHSTTWSSSMQQQYEHDKQELIMVKFLLYERALNYLPGSYKLWHNYLKDRIEVCQALCITDALVEETNNCFERCLTYLHKMPRIWMLYTEYLTYQRYITRTRKVFDRMLKALPITQHDRVWPLYIKFVRIAQVPEMAVRVYRRFVQLYPEQMEEFVEYLIKQKRFDEACVRLCAMVNDEQFDSVRGKSKFDYWRLLCQLLVKNAKLIRSLNVDAIIRSGIKKYPQEIGKLWVDLSEYYVRLGQFETARNVYDEALRTVTSVRDFGVVFDSFARFEESIIAMKYQQLEEQERQKKEQDAADEDGDEDDEDDNLFEVDDPTDIQLRIDRLEQLYKNRRILLSSVKLRQNPHNVDEWLQRAQIYLNPENNGNGDGDDDEEEEIDAEKVVETYTAAIATIDPLKVSGNHRLSAVWIAFGKFYEEYGDDLDDTRTIYAKAVTRNFKNIDDLASVWCEWAEMELRHGNYTQCRKVLKQALTLPNKNINELLAMKNKDLDTITVQQRLFKSKKLWAFLLDIEESMGTLREAQSVYNTVIDLKIASVQTILNYADLMERNQYFEEAYKIYERGIELFGFPHVLPIWKTYLHKFVQRYGDKKLERARDLFEQCLSECPPESNKEIYLLYARLEEKYGFARHAMRVYDKACLNMHSEQDQKEMFHIYINRAADLFGITRTREIYEKAIQHLNQRYLPDLCLSYISLELKLSEIDRARGIFQYGAQFANPKKFEHFWTKWHEFEVSFGNEDTFKEMLRIRRSVDVQYTHQQYNEQLMEIAATHASGASNKKQVENAAIDTSENDEMSELQKMEQQAMLRQQAEENIAKQKEIESVAAPDHDHDPNEIDIDIDIEPQSIPSAVYSQSQSAKKMGALDRFNNDD